jgi:hypothetical protein
MAGTTWEKRQRERAKREKKEAKRARRDARAERPEGDEDEPDRDELMARFTALNKEKAQGLIDEDTFTERKNEIWVALGLPTD